MKITIFIFSMLMISCASQPHRELDGNVSASTHQEEKSALTDSSTADTNATLGNPAGTRAAGGNEGMGTTGKTGGSGL